MLDRDRELRRIFGPKREGGSSTWLENTV